MACSRAGLIRAQTSGASRFSKDGNASRQASRAWSASSTALDLTRMRIASRSMVRAMLCAVGEAGSCEAMKSSMIPVASDSEREWGRSRRRVASPVVTADGSASAAGSGNQSASVGMWSAARLRTWRRP